MPAEPTIRRASAPPRRPLLWALALLLAMAGVGAAQDGGGPDPGRVVYVYRDALWSADRDGSRARPLTRGLAVYAYDVTADGARVAFAAGAWHGERKHRELAESALWMVKVDGTGLHRIGAVPAAHGGRPHVGRIRWAPDGKSFAFDVVSDRDRRAGGGLYVARVADGSVHRAAGGPADAFAWTPAGQLTYHARGAAPPQAAPPPAVTRAAAPPSPGAPVFVAAPSTGGPAGEGPAPAPARPPAGAVSSTGAPPGRAPVPAAAARPAGRWPGAGAE
jgi:hypothetical protein